MAGPLINASYVTLVGGRTFTDVEETRVEGLITIASNLVRSAAKADYSSTTAPEFARLAVARLVLSAFDSGQDSDGNVRAEQIGDYRVEYQRAASVQDMDLSIIDDLIKRIGRRAYSVRTPVAFDGPVTTDVTGGAF